MSTPAGGGTQTPPQPAGAQQGQGKAIDSNSLGGLVNNNFGGLVQGAIFGAVFLWGPDLSWWQWVLVAMVGFIIMLYFKQTSMLYPRSPPGMPKTPADNPPSFKHPGEHGIEYEDVYMDTPDGCKIHAWWIPHTGDTRSVATVMFFHGNAGNIGYRLPLLQELYKKGNMNLLVVDYRGYGFSTGEPSEPGLKIDAETALDWLLKREEVDPTRIVVFGKSLGGAVAVALAVKRPHHVRGVMLENTYTNMVNLSQDLFPLIKVIKCALPYLLHNKWDTESIIEELRVPVLFISGKQDNIIKPVHMKSLCKAALRSNKKVSFASLQGGHNNVPLVAGAVYQETINKFLFQFSADWEEAVAQNPKLRAGSSDSVDSGSDSSDAEGNHDDEDEKKSENEGEGPEQDVDEKQDDTKE